jgi:hypothetical protein
MPLQTDSIRSWALVNRGAQKLIAEYFGVSAAYVGHVLRSRAYSNRGRIEGVLADLGAPGMREREQEAKARSPREITWTDREKKRLMDQLKKIQGKGAAA